jgi:hypothetical protein
MSKKLLAEWGDGDCACEEYRDCQTELVNRFYYHSDGCFEYVFQCLACGHAHSFKTAQLPLAYVNKCRQEKGIPLLRNFEEFPIKNKGAVALHGGYDISVSLTSYVSDIDKDQSLKEMIAEITEEEN